MATLCCYRAGYKPRMLYRTKRGWYRDRDLIGLLDQAHQRLDGPIILVWDNLAAHRSRRMREAITAHPWLEVEYLTSYALELNPVEGAWSHLKRTAPANLAALTFEELSGAVRSGCATCNTALIWSRVPGPCQPQAPNPIIKPQ